MQLLLDRVAQTIWPLCSQSIRSTELLASSPEYDWTERVVVLPGNSWLWQRDRQSDAQLVHYLPAATQAQLLQTPLLLREQQVGMFEGRTGWK